MVQVLRSLKFSKCIKLEPIKESLLVNTKLQIEFQHSNFNMFRRDRASGKGGGIMVFVNKAYEIFDFHQNNFTSLSNH